ncbi:hypothetical protein Droror1_Dr00027767 [Drosera rotundifolia]
MKEEAELFADLDELSEGVLVTPTRRTNKELSLSHPTPPPPPPIPCTQSSIHPNTRHSTQQCFPFSSSSSSSTTSPQPPPPPSPTRLPLLSSLAATTSTTPTLYFQVTKPITHPSTTPCSYTLLHHDFAYTYTKPPVTAPYTPPSSPTCPHTNFAAIVLEWKATCKGRQYDRIFGVWLGGVELLRSCTAEPRATGIVWTVKKDVTKYYELFKKNQTLAVYLGNVVNGVYTGVYHVEVKLHFYPFPDGRDGDNGDRGFVGGDWRGRGSPRLSPLAQLILPISRDLPLNDGLWFEIENSTDVQSKEFRIPTNVYRAVVEVYLSPHENDEFWYSNYPNEYIEANNLTGTPGNGPFREVVVSIDGQVVGSIFPFTVIYTGGINPLLWRPITGIGSFDLPTYDIEITPFLEKLLDRKTHTIAFSVTNALNVWYIDANLQLWIDSKSKKTEAKTLLQQAKPLQLSSKLDFSGLDGQFLTQGARVVTLKGWVKSSYGNITTIAIQSLGYVNLMVMGNEGNLQTVNQTIKFKTTVTSQKLGFPAVSFSLNKKFPLYLYTNEIAAANASGYDLVTIVDFAFNEKRTVSERYKTWKSSLNNAQNAQGEMIVQDNLVTGGVGSTKQSYEFYGGKYCYIRNVGSSNYTILYDLVSSECPKEAAVAASLPFTGIHNAKLFRRSASLVPVYGSELNRGVWF